MANKVILHGRLASDAVIRATRNGDEVANLRVITTSSYLDKETGEWVDVPTGHSVSVFGGFVNYAKARARKGAPIYVEGELNYRKWTDDKNIERFAAEVRVAGKSGSLEVLAPPKGDRETLAPKERAPSSTRAEDPFEESFS